MVTAGRVLSIFALLLSVEVGVFCMKNQDLLSLRRTHRQIDAASSDRFAADARRALTRSSLTTRQLWALVEDARTLHRTDLETQALQRLVLIAPHESSPQLQLADALRRQGKFADASAIYQHLLTAKEPSR